MHKQREFAVTGEESRGGAAQDVLRSLRRIFHAVDRHSRQLARLYGLTEPQAICLGAIDRMTQINPGQLARTVSLSPPTVTGILDRLERRHLIKRERTARDKRQVVVCLTDEGRALLQCCPPSLQECFTRRLADLPGARQRQIANALNEVVRLLEAEDIEAAPLLARGAAHGDLAGEPAGDSLPFIDPNDTGRGHHDGH
jgi:DNA-binding MarR family transcriptional regulator